MLEMTKSALAYLSDIDPALPRAALVATVFVVVWLLRKLLPGAWEGFARLVPGANKIDPPPVLMLIGKSWQALPAALIGAALLALQSGLSVKEAVRGAVFGALAALAHEVMKAVPWLPYSGATGGKEKAPSVPPTAALVLLLAFALPLQGCALFQGVSWPKVLRCAGPVAQAELQAVSDILHGNGDVRTELTDLAKVYAPSTIECAVQEVIDGLSKRGEAAPADLRASARGRVFLAEVQQ